MLGDLFLSQPVSTKHILVSNVKLSIELFVTARTQVKNSPMYENLHLPANTRCDVYQLSATVPILLSLYDTVPYLVTDCLLTGICQTMSNL